MALTFSQALSGRSLLEKAFRVVDVAYTAALHPIQTVSAIASKEKTVFADVYVPQTQKSTKEQLKDIGGAAITLGATLTGAAAVGAAAKAGTLGTKAATVAKSLIPSTTKGKVIAAVAAPVVIGAVAEQPGKSLKAVVSAPGELAQFGGDVANLLADPSLANLKEVVTESPLISAGLAAVGVVAGGSAILGAVQSQRTIKAIEGIGGSIPTDAVQALPYTPPQTLPSTAPSSKIPLTPQTQEVGATARRKRRKSSIKQPSMIQRVTVNLQNKSLKIGKYLNSNRLLS